MFRLPFSVALLAMLAAAGDAQRIPLELRPKMGDTLRLRLDQVTEVSGGRQGGTPTQAVTTMRMFSRVIVESTAPASAVIFAITDSVEVTSTDGHAAALADNTERQLRGRKMRLRLTPDGTVSVADQAGVPREVSELVSVMPASFPREPVEVGSAWTREMPINAGASFGVPVGGVVRATFRLDSLSRGGDLAYISLRGSMEQQPGHLAVESVLAGTVNGTMVVNRRRGWLSESRFSVETRTTVSARGAAPMTPMQFRMKISQHMRVVDKR